MFIVVPSTCGFDLLTFGVGELETKFLLVLGIDFVQFWAIKFDLTGNSGVEAVGLVELVVFEVVVFKEEVETGVGVIVGVIVGIGEGVKVMVGSGVVVGLAVGVGVEEGIGVVVGKIDVAVWLLK